MQITYYIFPVVSPFGINQTSSINIMEIFIDGLFFLRQDNISNGTSVHFIGKIMGSGVKPWMAF